MMLIGCLQLDPSKGFKITNFKIDLLNYIKIIINIVLMTSLIELIDVSRKLIKIEVWKNKSICKTRSIINKKINIQ